MGGGIQEELSDGLLQYSTGRGYAGVSFQKMVWSSALKTLLLVCVSGVGHGAVLEPFPQWSCVTIIQAWGHTTVSLGLSRKNSTDEFAAFLHTSQYLRFCKNVLKIGT